MSKIAKIKTKRKLQPYNKADLKSALEAVANGESVRSASKMFKVPYSTLRCKHVGISPLDTRSGPPSVLTDKEEEELKTWMLKMSEVGFPVTKHMLINSVAKIVRESKRSNPFKDGVPGKHWLQNFLSRHSELSLDKFKNVCQTKNVVTNVSMRNWYKEVDEYLRSNNLIDIDGSRIFNCEEIALLLKPHGDNVVVKKNLNSVFNLSNSKKECLTVLITGNAAGQLAPPMLVLTYKRIPAAILDSIEKDWAIGKSNNGWMTAETFHDYIVNTFYPWCIRNQIQFPIIIYMDKHKSYTTSSLSNFCKEHKIELISLHENATHIQQPMNVSFFPSLKESWKKSVIDWRMENAGITLEKSDFAPVFKTTLNSLDSVAILNGGFQCCGLSPFSADALDYSKLLISSNLKENIATNSQTLRPLKNPQNRQITMRCIEDFLSQSVLHLFKTTHESGEDWHGAKEFQELFALWKKCQQSTAKSKNKTVK